MQFFFNNKYSQFTIIFCGTKIDFSITKPENSMLTTKYNIKFRYNYVKQIEN